MRAGAAHAEGESLHALASPQAPGRSSAPTLLRRRRGQWLRSEGHWARPDTQTLAFLTQWQLAAKSRLLIKLLACKTNGELVEDPCPVPLKEGPFSDSC